MIDASRFLVRSSEREAWLQARRGGVTATAVAEAATGSGFQKVAAERRDPVDVIANDYMIFGTESEAAIMRYAHHEHGILPSDWLVCAENNPHHLATPDGLSLDHAQIAEVKTTSNPWDGAENDPAKLPIKYRRQVQFQLYVTGADACLFLWQQRIPEGDWFRFGFWEPRTVWIEPDLKMQAALVDTANRLLEASNERTLDVGTSALVH